MHTPMPVEFTMIKGNFKSVSAGMYVILYVKLICYNMQINNVKLPLSETKFEYWMLPLVNIGFTGLYLFTECISPDWCKGTMCRGRSTSRQFAPASTNMTHSCVDRGLQLFVGCTLPPVGIRGRQQSGTICPCQVSWGVRCNDGPVRALGACNQCSKTMGTGVPPVLLNHLTTA